jgi:hypothetical protein
MNPVPTTVKVKDAPPAEAVDGEIEVIVGSGLSSVVDDVELPLLPPPQPSRARSITSIAALKGSFSFSGHRSPCPSLRSIFAFALNDFLFSLTATHRRSPV